MSLFLKLAPSRTVIIWQISNQDWNVFLKTLEIYNSIYFLYLETEKYNLLAYTNQTYKGVCDHAKIEKKYTFAIPACGLFLTCREK